MDWLVITQFTQAEGASLVFMGLTRPAAHAVMTTHYSIAPELYVLLLVAGRWKV